VRDRTADHAARDKGHHLNVPRAATLIPPSRPALAGIEQEYTLFEHDKKTVLGWPKHGFPAGLNPGTSTVSVNYCGVGADCVGRAIIESHARACLFAGIRLSGVNLETMPGACEYQLGPANGLTIADQLWMSRYILARVCEEVSCSRGVRQTLSGCISAAARTAAKQPR
jgi:glutamine synthetase